MQSGNTCTWQAAPSSAPPRKAAIGTPISHDHARLRRLRYVIQFMYICIFFLCCFQFAPRAAQERNQTTYVGVGICKTPHTESASTVRSVVRVRTAVTARQCGLLVARKALPTTARIDERASMHFRLSDPVVHGQRDLFRSRHLRLYLRSRARVT